MAPTIAVSLDHNLAARCGIDIPAHAWSQGGTTFFATHLADADKRFWNNTLKIEYPKCMNWINRMVASRDKSMTAAKVYILCEVIRKTLETAKAKCYAPPTLAKAVGSGRKTTLSSSLSPVRIAAGLVMLAERRRRTLIRALLHCPIFLNGSNNTKATLLRGLVHRCNSDLRRQAYQKYHIDIDTKFGSGTYLSNLSLGSSDAFAISSTTAELTVGDIFPSPQYCGFISTGSTGSFFPALTSLTPSNRLASLQSVL
ncbi:hypothetical protein LTR56_022346 [Elasticomyces elasticus]|nr:hypothetical protein LTR56_022346 [Elasticomyces elasticus]KAK3629000.1 hypothetical protein LTR22_022076 [Elasticomyces elasticus]KAK4908537.1 hypothetical protein LTR49_022560 [Elasticomyces elasticus]KAK5734289.1 hypothetical protein LTS12_026740 [Elasticomyces elasticus]